MKDEPCYVVFCGVHLIAEGPARDVFAVLKDRFDKRLSDGDLVFDVATGRQTDFDWSLPLEALLDERHEIAPRKPGRPKLGVTSREVTLLPRHWDWLEQQPNGISAAMRRLVEQAMKQNPGREKARRIRTSLNHVLTAIAGDWPHYEEVTRALFANDVQRVGELVAEWPVDCRGYVLREARAAYEAEA
jgi:hypothetical protein